MCVTCSQFIHLLVDLYTTGNSKKISIDVQSIPEVVLENLESMSSSATTGSYDKSILLICQEILHLFFFYFSRESFSVSLGACPGTHSMDQLMLCSYASYSSPPVQTSFLVYVVCCLHENYSDMSKIESQNSFLKQFHLYFPKG